MEHHLMALPLLPLALGGGALFLLLANRKNAGAGGQPAPSSPGAAPGAPYVPPAVPVTPATPATPTAPAKPAFLVARNGAKFVPVSPPANIGPPPEIASQIRVGDTVTFDLASAGLQIEGVPNGNIIGKVTRAPGSGSTLDIVPIDPRLPAGMSPVTIPVSAVSGISPGDE
jgi:hypothetical protein